MSSCLSAVPTLLPRPHRHTLWWVCVPRVVAAAALCCGLLDATAGPANSCHLTLVSSDLASTINRWIIKVLLNTWWSWGRRGRWLVALEQREPQGPIGGSRSRGLLSFHQTPPCTGTLQSASECEAPQVPERQSRAQRTIPTLELSWLQGRLFSLLLLAFESMENRAANSKLHQNSPRDQKVMREMARSVLRVRVRY